MGWLWQGLVIWPRLSVLFEILKFLRTWCVSFSRIDSDLCIYHLFVRSNLNYLKNSPWITFPTQSCLVLYSFCANLLHSHITWWYLSSVPPTGWVWHKAFFKVGPGAGQSTHVPTISENASDPVGILLKGAPQEPGW